LYAPACPRRKKPESNAGASLYGCLVTRCGTCLRSPILPARWLSETSFGGNDGVEIFEVGVGVKSEAETIGR